MSAKQKLRDNRGFSLAEMLLAVLILLLVSAIVATGVPAARNAYYKVILASNAQSLLSTTVTALRDELGTAWDIIVDDDDTLTYFDADSGYRKMLSNGDTALEVTVCQSVSAFTKDSESNAKSTVYSLPPEKTATDGMIVSYDGVSTPEAGDNVVVFGSLEVTKDGVTLASLENLSIRVFSANTESISGYGTADD